MAPIESGQRARAGRRLPYALAEQPGRVIARGRRPAPEPPEGLDSFSKDLFRSMRRSDQRRWAEFYLYGLLMTSGRKTVTRMVQALSAPPADQGLQQFVNQSPWSWEEVRGDLARLVEQVVRPEAWVVQPVYFPKSGEQSVAVARQFVPDEARSVHCQAAMSLWLAGGLGGCPVDWTLVLPARWRNDTLRRSRAGVPTGVDAQEPWECALELALDWTQRSGGQQRPVILDLRGAQPGVALQRLLDKQILFVAQVGKSTFVQAESWSAPTAGCRPAGEPLSVADVVTASAARPRTLARRRLDGDRPEGTFVAIPVRSVPLPGRKAPAGAPRPERSLLLLVEQDRDGGPPAYFISNLTGTPLAGIDRLLGLRRRTAAEQHDLEEDLGLTDFEGRSFRGWHHHVTLVSAARAFQLRRHERIDRLVEHEVHRLSGAVSRPWPTLAVAVERTEPVETAWLVGRGTVRELQNEEVLTRDSEPTGPLALLLDGELVTTRTVGGSEEVLSRQSCRPNGDLVSPGATEIRVQLVALPPDTAMRTTTTAVGPTRVVVYDPDTCAEIAGRLVRIAGGRPEIAEPAGYGPRRDDPPDPGGGLAVGAHQDNRLAAVVRSAAALRSALASLEAAFPAAAPRPRP